MQAGDLQSSLGQLVEELRPRDQVGADDLAGVEFLVGNPARVECKKSMHAVVLACGVGGGGAEAVPFLRRISRLLQELALHRRQHVLAVLIGGAAGQLERDAPDAVAIFLDQHDAGARVSARLRTPIRETRSCGRARAPCRWAGARCRCAPPASGLGGYISTSSTCHGPTDAASFRASAIRQPSSRRRPPARRR